MSKKASQPVIWSADDELTVAEAAHLLSQCDIRNNESERKASNRTRLRISRAIADGDLKYTKNGKLRLGVLIAWARQKRGWRGKFRDLPADPQRVAIRGASTLPAIGVQAGQIASGTLVVIPSSINAQIVERRRALETEIALRDENKKLRELIEAKEVEENKRKEINRKKGKRSRF
jgi:hypothetical protein